MLKPIETIDSIMFKFGLYSTFLTRVCLMLFWMYYQNPSKLLRAWYQLKIPPISLNMFNSRSTFSFFVPSCQTYQQRGTCFAWIIFDNQNLLLNIIHIEHPTHVEPTSCFNPIIKGKQSKNPSLRIILG